MRGDAEGNYGPSLENVKIINSFAQDGAVGPGKGNKGRGGTAALGCPAEAKPPYRRLSLLCPKSCAKSQLPAYASQDVSIPQAIGSSTPKSPASCPPSARDRRRAPQCHRHSHP